MCNRAKQFCQTPKSDGSRACCIQICPGQYHQQLLDVDDAAARSFDEIEAVKNAWPAREMERQINSLRYERLALSKDKKGLLRLAAKGHEVQKPADVFKDPMVIKEAVPL